MIYFGADSMRTALGDREATFCALEEARTGLKYDAELEMIAGRINGYTPKAGFTKLESLLLDCIGEVCQASGVSLSDSRTALVLSTTKGNVELLAGKESIPEDAFLGVTAAKLARELGCANEPVVISNACISGVSAFVVARRMILGGKADRVIVAGCDTLSRFIATGFASFKSISSEPCKPYDAGRNGLNIGEACGAVLLTCDKSEAGGTKAIALEGGAVSDDANHISGPSRTGDGLFFAIDNAMKQAGICADQVGFVNCHGTATAYNDEMESKAVTLAGLQYKPLNSMKGYFGHTFGAAGVIETIICAEELRRGRIYGTKGFSLLGVPCPIVVSADSQPIGPARCVKTASGFGGCNAAIVLADASLGDSPSDEPVIADMQTFASLSMGCTENFAEYIRAEYKALNDANLKFFKMSDLAKLAYVGCEKLLAGRCLKEEYEPRDIAIILSNRSASLDDDRIHQKNIESPEGASPAVFVYTLPNVAAGEVCIRKGFKGDNTFFIEDAPTSLCEDYARYLITRGHAKAVVWGWCEQLGNKAEININLSTIR